MNTQLPEIFAQYLEPCKPSKHTRPDLTLWDNPLHVPGGNPRLVQAYGWEYMDVQTYWADPVQLNRLLNAYRNDKVLESLGWLAEPNTFVLVRRLPDQDGLDGLTEYVTLEHANDTTITQFNACIIQHDASYDSDLDQMPVVKWQHRATKADYELDSLDRSDSVLTPWSYDDELYESAVRMGDYTPDSPAEGWKPGNKESAYLAEFAALTNKETQS